MVFLGFLFTFLELALAGVAYALHSQSVFAIVVIYGSPFYLLMNLFGSDSVFFNNNTLYLSMFIFHIIKYITIFRAQLSGDRGALFWLMGLFEISYLVLCGYYLN